jgi:hypothetical protein
MKCRVISYSNPRKYAESSEYFEFLNFCKDEGKKILPLLFQKLAQGDFFVVVSLNDLTLSDNIELMREVKKENNEHIYDEDGAFIIYTLYGNWMKYVKKLLNNFEEIKEFSSDPNYSKSSQKNEQQSISLLNQNYPNPFNPTTQIKFVLSNDNRITLKIYDILGKEVAILLSDEFKSTGQYSLEWNSRNLQGKDVPSGMYFCRLISGSQVKTIKLMVVR